MMKKLASLLLLFSFAANAGLPPTTLKDLSGNGGTTFNFKTYPNQVTSLGGVNALLESTNGDILSNPGFEGVSATQGGWIAGTGVTATIDSSNFHSGKQSALLSFSSASGTLWSEDVTPTSQKNGIMETSKWLKTTTSGQYLCPRQGGTTLYSSTYCGVVPSDGLWHQVYATNISWPSSGSVGIALYAPSAITGSANADDAYLGDARNLSSNVVVSPWTSFTCTGSWTTNATYNCLHRQVGDTDQIQYTVSLSGAPNSTGLTLNYPPGETPNTSEITNGSFFHLGEGNIVRTGVNQFALVAMYNGTTSFIVNYLNTSSGSNPVNVSSASQVTATAPATWASGDAVTINITVPISAWGFGTSLNPNTTPQFPTVTKLLSGSGTYTTPLGVTRLEIEMVGGGGGGGGSGTTTTAGVGGNGGNTTFGTSFISANGGSGGSISGGSGGGGGSASCGTLSTCVAIPGGAGTTGGTPSVAFSNGGAGGSSALFGGGGSSGGLPGNGFSGASNTGGGGGGASTGSAANVQTGAGGGGGGGIKATISNPAASYAYCIGNSGSGCTGGAAGTAGSGTAANAGGAGGTGAIYITEYYNSSNAPIINPTSFTNSIAFTSHTATSWTTPATITSNSIFKFTICGAGGGGGGAKGLFAAASGGGGGGCGIIWATGPLPNTTYSLTVGTGGTAGAATPTSGGNGGSSSITINSTTLTAGGGSGAASSSNSSVSFVGGGLGGPVSGFTINSAGTQGAPGVSIGSGNSLGGGGGAGIFAGSGPYSFSQPGFAGGACGGGGGGGSSNSASTGEAGGAGADGCIIIEWVN